MQTFACFEVNIKSQLHLCKKQAAVAVQFQSNFDAIRIQMDLARIKNVKSAFSWKSDWV